ncbi:MAG: ABC-2 family transporter protein [Herpetosiphon sp.]
MRALLLVWFSHMSAYRAEIVIWMLTGSTPLIMLAVWSSKARAAGGTINGMSISEFGNYFLAAWLTQQFIVCWVAYQLDRQIRFGELSPKLLRPVNVMWDHLFAHLGERIVRLPLMLGMLLIGFFLVPGLRLTPDLPHAVVYVISVNIAFAIRFMIASAIGTLGFWFDQAVALDELYWVVALFLTGTFAPLSLYPPAVQSVLDRSPFPYLVYYPVQILIGKTSWIEAGSILLIQTGWLVLFGVVRSLLWSRGLRRYGAVGA